MNTPVLLLVFNRPDHISKLLKALEPVKPKRIFAVADGPRKGVEGEEQKCAAVRKLIDEIPWECEINTLYRVENMGCAQSVGRGITWFFEQVEEGIILEDDCIPHPDFFPFCEELLHRYRDVPEVVHIGGNNFQEGKKRGQADYYFSIYNHIWGWATWRNAWRNFSFDIDPEGTPEMRKFLHHNPTWKFMRDQFHNVVDGKLDSWGFRWTYACWNNCGISVVPNVNMVTNIGFGEGATHTTASESPQSNLSLNGMNWPLTHPKKLKINRRADRFTFRKVFKPFNLRAYLSNLKQKALGRA